jgi:uncharacterized membrane protein
MIKYHILIVIAVILSTCGQIFLKIGVKKNKYKHYIYLYLNVHTITGYIFLFSATLFSLYSLRILPVKVLAFILPLSFIFVMLFSKIFLKESISKLHIIGTILIGIGILVFNY